MTAPLARARPARPRLGFLGVGWIGRRRMSALIDSGVAEVAAIADLDPEMRGAAVELAPGAQACGGVDELLDSEVDGIVIATPSAFHAEQSIAALDAGVAVFCQKPLARTAAEASEVIEAARRVDRPLAVDLSYRHTEAMRRIRGLVDSGELGRVYAADLVFHNAYGPDRPWFYERASSGGGCVIDLGVHLIDLGLWLLDFPGVETARSSTFCAGELLEPGDPRVEDHAMILLELEGGAVARIACSWRLHAGRDAVIEVALWGTRGGAAMRNVDGSFYDFVAERYRGTRREPLAGPPDPWGARALVAWARRVARGDGFDPTDAQLIRTHQVIDAVYGLPEATW